jgi:hypothetical protein
VAERQPNAQYNVASAGSLPVRVAAYMRRRMYERFIEIFPPAETGSILDVGATSEASYQASNYLEAWYPHRERIVAVGIDDLSGLPTLFPGVRAVQADGLSLPFPDKSFDVVHSSAVIEHVGSAQRQRAFLAELFRVARKGVFVTTPNRWFPIEFHTVLPLVHWLPAKTFRALLAHTDRVFFSQEEHLNLMDGASLLEAARALGRGELLRFRLFGWTSNLGLVLRAARSP